MVLFGISYSFELHKTKIEFRLNYAKQSLQQGLQLEKLCLTGWKIL